MIPNREVSSGKEESEWIQKLKQQIEELKLYLSKLIRERSQNTNVIP